MLVFVVYNRRREAQIKYPGPDDDVRENIINYEDEGGGEDDMTAFDITPLQVEAQLDRSQYFFYFVPQENITPLQVEAQQENQFQILVFQIPIADPSLAHRSLPRQKIPCKFLSSNIECCILHYKILNAFDKILFRHLEDLSFSLRSSTNHGT